MRLCWWGLAVAITATSVSPTDIIAQEARPTRARIRGRIVLAEVGTPLPGVIVSVEGMTQQTISDTLGRYVLAGVPPGPQVLVARRIGFAPVRVSLTVPANGVVEYDISMARHALKLPEIRVTADMTGRARGELGTSTVIERDAIEHQTSTSLAGVLELAPGVPIQPPGLDAVQQFAIRAVPTRVTSGLTSGGPSGSDIGSFGTVIIIDGVPFSNNANLQTTGPRGEVRLVGATAGGGVDLRQIPASTIERVEIIRGVPSVRYGDLTQGAIIVETRAGVVQPQARARLDVRTLELSAVGGWSLGRANTLTGTVDVARTRISPGISQQATTRVTAQLAHRAGVGGSLEGGASRRFTLLTRLDLYQLLQDDPENPEVQPGLAASNHDRGLRLQERVRLQLSGGETLTLTTAVNYTRRRSSSQRVFVRGALPFTDRLTEGQQEGHFIGGPYLAQLRIEGEEWNIYNRLEVDARRQWVGFEHRIRLGVELRREWNVGPGLQFDIQRPLQVTFNGVQGFDRPRRFDAIPPVATSAVYLDDRLIRSFLGDVTIDLQTGLRVDMLHRGGLWASAIQDAVLQPRVSVQVAPWTWLRLRAGWGRTAKAPALGLLYPAPQFFDVVNVNWFTTDPDERLAVLTTAVRDPTNRALRFAVGEKREAGFELVSTRGRATLSFVVFRDRTTDAVGFRQDPGFVLRERFALSDSTTGTGRQPDIVRPAFVTDTMPVLIGRPDNVLTLESRGVEATVTLPELRPLRLTFEVQGAWVRTRFFSDAPDFGRSFESFQLNPAIPRAPFWDGVEREGERGILTYRMIYHEPRFGLVMTAVIQHFVHEVVRDLAGTDTLAFAGFVTRTGELTRVPPAERSDSRFADLQVPRLGVLTMPTNTPSDWFATIRISKTIPGGGELRFYAFNVLDRLGKFGERITVRRQFLPLRFGIELSLPLAIGTSSSSTP